MEFNKSVVTNQGRELMAKLLSKKATTEFTQVVISSTEYQDSQLEELTVLSNIKQTSKAQAYSNNKTTVSATAAINNEGITEGYYINTVGLYATDPDKGEILYSVSTAKVNGYMPPDIGVSKSGFSFTIYTEVGNAEQVDVTVDPSGYANKSDIQILSERITKNKNDSEEKFIPKLSAENGLFVRKNSKILDLNDAVEPGIYSIPATGVENKPLPNSGSLIVNKDPGGVRQLFQTERTIVIRQFGGIPSKWTDWKEVSFTTNVVNLTEPQRIGGTKEFTDIPLVNGTEIALKEDVFFYQKTGLDEVQADYKASFNEETNMFLIREGNRVDAYLRVNVVDIAKLKTAFVPIFQIPDGFKIDLSMRESFWNVPLTVTQYTYPQGNYGALYEMNVKGIRFGSDRLGNHYLHGSWHTNDPIPDTEFKYMLYVNFYKLSEGRDFVSGSYKGEMHYVAVEIDGQLGEKAKVSDGFYKYTVGSKINKVSQNAWVIGYDKSGTEITRSKIKIL